MDSDNRNGKELFDLNSTSARTLQILSLLSQADQPMTLTQISEMLSAPVSSTCNIISTMLKLGFVRLSDPKMKTYTIGIKAYEAGIAYIKNTNFVGVAKPFLEKMSRESETTTFLGVQNGARIVYLDKVESSKSVRTTAVLGSYKGMYFTGLGKAILASMPDKAVEDMYYGSVFQAYTENTICDIERLKDDLQQTRERGYAIDDREGEISLYCIAAPVRNHAGKVIAAVSIASFYDLLTEESRKKNADILVSNAVEISRLLGYSGTLLY
ncbi:MAG: IclR family transcriptional regulator [Eubacteriales bacterium]